jgi:hypothetical protein
MMKTRRLFRRFIWRLALKPGSQRAGPRPDPDPTRLVLELGVVFVLLPLLANAYIVPIPKIPTLILVALTCALILGRDPSWSWRPVFISGPRAIRPL